MDEKDMFDSLELDNLELDPVVEKGTAVTLKEVAVDVDFNELDKEESVIPTTTAASSELNFDGLEEEENVDETDVNNFFDTIEAEKGKKKGKKAAEKKTEAPKETKEPEFVGPRPVIVYGNELFVETNPEVTLESIRERVEKEFLFPEFSKDQTTMTFDNKTGIIVPVRGFNKKG